MSALPANFWDDLNDPDVQYAEQLVYDYLRHRGWDFEVYPHPGFRWRLDVKADSYFDGSAARGEGARGRVMRRKTGVRMRNRVQYCPQIKTGPAGAANAELAPDGTPELSRSAASMTISYSIPKKFPTLSADDIPVASASEEAAKWAERFGRWQISDDLNADGEADLLRLSAMFYAHLMWARLTDEAEAGR